MKDGKDSFEFFVPFIDEGNQAYAPDCLDSMQINEGIPPSMVISRNPDSSVLSRYSDDVWDFTPYSARRVQLNFRSWLSANATADKQAAELYNHICSEMKVVMWLLMFDRWHNGGRDTKPGGFMYYFIVLRRFAKMAYTLGICLSDAHTSERFQVALRSSIAQSSKGMPISLMEAFVPLVDRLHKLHHQTHTAHLANILIVPEDSWSSVKALANRIVRSNESEQTPLIPTRILANLIEYCEAIFDAIEPCTDGLIALLRDVYDPSKPGYFCDTRRQYNNRKAKLSLPSQLTWRTVEAVSREDAYKDHKLTQFLQETLNGKTDLLTLKAYLAQVQMTCAIYLFSHTGMRWHELNVAPYNCFERVSITGVGLVPFIKTHTSKINQDNYSRATVWVTSDKAERAVRIAQAIAQMHWIINTREPWATRGTPLWINQNWNTSKPKLHYAAPFRLPDIYAKNSLFGDSIMIKSTDLEELILFDSFRDWDADEQFKEGQLWPLASHQFRRSVAVYASRSGMVSLPSLSVQYKHLSLTMTAVYAENSAFAQAFILDDEGNAPRSHRVLIDFNDARRFNESIAFHEQVIQAETRLSGGSGKHIQAYKDCGDLPAVFADREATENAMKRGELAYRETVVGGCMRKDLCDNYGIDEVVPCVFRCADAVIGGDGGKKLKLYAESLAIGLDQMEAGSPAYMTTAHELDRIKAKLLDEEGIDL